MSWLRPIDCWFAEAVLPHEPELLRQARRWAGGEDEAQDLLHEAYAQLLQLTAWDQIANPPAYAVRTIRNLALQRFRRAQIVPMRQFAALEELAIPDAAPDSFAVVAARQELRLLSDAIAALPPQPARVVRLRKIDGLSPRDIAERLEISLSTVEKHLARGMILLAQAMRGLESEPAAASHTPSARARLLA